MWKFQLNLLVILFKRRVWCKRVEYPNLELHIFLKYVFVKAVKELCQLVGSVL